VIEPYAPLSDTVLIDRRSGTSRRQEDSDRRRTNRPVAEQRRQGERRKTQRRRQIDPTTCERDYTSEEIEFMQALDAYKRRSGRMFPTCSEVLEVIRSLGYSRAEDDSAVASVEEITSGSLCSQ
jgi:hypothetical protein